MLNNNIFCNYPDAMTLAQLAECLNISTKLASRLVHEKRYLPKKSDGNTASRKTLWWNLSAERKNTRKKVVL